MNWSVKIESLGKQYALGRSNSSSGLLADRISVVMRHPLNALGNIVARKEPDKFWALRNVNLAFSQGEVVGVVGRNGAGKSTLLKILSRITEPTSGRALVRGRLASLLEVGTGFHPELSGRENIFLNATILGMKRKEIERAFDEIVAFSGVERFLDSPVKHYSSGMYVRLAFAVAAHIEADILLVDEVLSVGDGEFQQRSMGKMREVATSGRTVLFVSHALDSVRRLCKTCVWMDAGEVKDVGRTDEVLAKYAGSGELQSSSWVPANVSTDAPVRVDSVAIHGAGDDDGMCSPEREMLVTIDYTVLAPTNGRCAIAIADEWGQTVLSSASTDQTTALNSVTNAGSWRSTCVMPAHLLAPGRYFVSVAVPGAHGTSQVFERVVALRVSQIGSLVSRDGRQGVVAPMLDWRTAPRPPGETVNTRKK